MCNVQGGARKQLAQLDEIFLNVHCAYCLLDADGVFVRINAAGLSLLGLSGEEMPGKLKLADLLAPASAAIFPARYQQHREAGTLRDLELELLLADGGSFSVLLGGNVIRDASGRFAMSLIVLRNKAQA